VWAEAEIIKDREIIRMANEAILWHAAGCDIMAPGKKVLDKAIKRLK
jgi:delta-aminolevulinic acid dehydratase/porphobilinogen synthase